MVGAHKKIKIATYNAISKVHRGNAKVEKHVVRILRKLGHSGGNWNCFVVLLTYHCIFYD